MLLALAIPLLLIVFSLASCLFALLKGGAAERIGAGVILANLVIGAANEYLAQSQIITLSIDALTALALLVMALRYASLWLGAVMLLYAVQFALHAYYIVLDRPRDGLHIAINNADFVAVCLCLVIGTALSRRRQSSGAPRESAASAS